MCSQCQHVAMWAIKQVHIMHVIKQAGKSVSELVRGLPSVGLYAPCCLGPYPFAYPTSYVDEEVSNMEVSTLIEHIVESD